jgi:hypothetical protein
VGNYELEETAARMCEWPVSSAITGRLVVADLGLIEAKYEARSPRH